MNIASNESSLERFKTSIFRLAEKKSERNLVKLTNLLELPFFEIRHIVKEAIKHYSKEPYLVSLIITKLNSTNPAFSTDLLEVMVDILGPDNQECIDIILKAIPFISEFNRRSLYRIMMKIPHAEIYVFFHNELEKNMKNPDPSIIRFLGKIKYSPAFLLLFKLLDNENIRVVEAAVDALANYESELFIPKLIEILLRFLHISLMRTILSVLSRFKTDEIFIAMIKCICILELEPELYSILTRNFGEYLSGENLLQIYENLHPELKKEMYSFLFNYFDSFQSRMTDQGIFILCSVLSFVNKTNDPIFIKYMSHFLCSENEIIAMKGYDYFVHLRSLPSTTLILNEIPDLIENPRIIFKDIDRYQQSIKRYNNEQNGTPVNYSFAQWLNSLNYMAKIRLFRLFTLRNYDTNSSVLFRILDFLANFRSSYIENYLLFQYIRFLSLSEPDMNQDIHKIMIKILHKNHSFTGMNTLSQIMMHLSNLQIEAIMDCLNYLSSSGKAKNKNLLIIYATIVQRNQYEYIERIFSWYFDQKFSMMDCFENLKVPIEQRKRFVIEILKMYKKSTNNDFKALIKSNLSFLTADLKPTLFYNVFLEKLSDLSTETLLMHYLSAEGSERLFIIQLIDYLDLSMNEIKETIKTLGEKFPEQQITIAKYWELMKYLEEKHAANKIEIEIVI